MHARGVSVVRMLLAVNCHPPIAPSSPASSTSAGATACAKVSASASVGRRLAAILHVGFRFQHQQVAPADLIARARQVHRHLFVLLGRVGEQAILHEVPHIRAFPRR